MEVSESGRRELRVEGSVRAGAGSSVWGVASDEKDLLSDAVVMNEFKRISNFIQCTCIQLYMYSCISFLLLSNKCVY